MRIHIFIVIFVDQCGGAREPFVIILIQPFFSTPFSNQLLAALTTDFALPLCFYFFMKLLLWPLCMEKWWRTYTNIQIKGK